MSDAIDIAAIAEQRDLAVAQRDAALAQLRAIVAIVDRVGGYMRHDDQVELRTAKALLVEVGR